MSLPSDQNPPSASPPPERVFRGQRVVLPGGVTPASVYVAGGVVTRILDYGEVPPGMQITEAGDAALMPGIVDTHVHVNDPGRTEWEGFESATRAAAAGGVTTLVDMPLNSVPATTTVAGLRAKLAAAADRCQIDVGFWGGVVPGNAGDLEALWAGGVLGFKCFLSPSGVEEFTSVTEADLRVAMPILSRLGAPLLVHAEDPAVLACAAAAAPAPDARRYEDYLRSRPAEAEVEAIRLMVALCREFGTRIHLVHLSAAEALPLLAGARAAGLPITVESCPHYLHFAAEEIADGATEFKCAPPIRGRENRERLWAALGSGEIDLIASDHSPCPPEMKAREAGDFAAAWGGVASLQLSLSVIWGGARERGYGLADLVEWMSAAPARLAGLSMRKGAIAAGLDADLVIWDPDADFVVAPEMLHHRHPLTPYVGALLPGVVQATYVRGECVYDRGAFPRPGWGRSLGRVER